MTAEPAGADDPKAGTGLASLRHGCPEPLSQRYDVALLDLDGVVYVGPHAVPGAPEALAKAAGTGMRLAYVTNNASRTPAAVAGQLAGFGVPAAAADVITSAQAAATLLASRLAPGAPVLVIGSTALRIAVREKGLRPVSTALDQPAAVVQGYAPGIGYPQFLEGGLAVRAGAWFVATNADATLPSPRGIQPGNGSLCQVIAHGTGQQPVVAGKPEPPLHAEAVARTGAHRPLVVGDRLDTDIEGAVRAGAPSLLVLTGISRPADVAAAPPGQRPSYLAADLTGLLEPHPAVTSDGPAFCCGGWRAHGGHGGAGLSLDGAGDPVDGLRALCAAAWSLDHVSTEMIRPALARLGPLAH